MTEVKSPARKHSRLLCLSQRQHGVTKKSVSSKSFSENEGIRRCVLHRAFPGRKIPRPEVGMTSPGFVILPENEGVTKTTVPVPSGDFIRGMYETEGSFQECESLVNETGSRLRTARVVGTRRTGR